MNFVAVVTSEKKFYASFNLELEEKGSDRDSDRHRKRETVRV